MDRWDPPPPSKLQRWIAGHAVLLQVALACLALASGVLFVIGLRSDGWGASVVGRLLNVVVLLGLIWMARGVARSVGDYDRRQGAGPN